MSLLIGISMGDFSGIGPETVLKAIAADLELDETRYFLIGDVAQTRNLNQRLGLKVPLPASEKPDPSVRVSFCNQETAPLPPDLQPGSALAARAAVAWLNKGAQLALNQEIDALVTAPVNKESIIRAGVPFIGQTEFLSQLAQANKTAMMLLGHDNHGVWLRVALATTHLPLKDVASQLTGNKIAVAVELASQACLDLGLPRARVGVCGLNPHAGEGGQMGTEEQTIIDPVVGELQRRGIDVCGPISADALFYYAYKGEYDAVVAMYHDQGLVPLKMIAFEHGVNWTLGLPFLRTSPDHGTAYDIAGKNKANPSSMRAALNLARKLARKRM
jgi:4-hydroxythreonine-4-phosphate dehydrogenase